MCGKRITVWLIAGITILILAACGMRKQENTMQTKEEKVVVELNQRQKEILRSKGLPETTEELDLNQLNAIVEIEKALEYLEEKYEKTFCYAGFAAQDLLSGESVFCYEEGTPPQRVIQVSYIYDKGNRSFQDNYAEVQASDHYEKDIQDFFLEKWNMNVLAAPEIYELHDVSSEENVIKNSSALCYIFFSDDAISHEVLKERAKEFSKWLTEEQAGATGDFRLYNMDAEAMEDLCRYNVEDVMNQYGFLDRATVWITEDGYVNVK